MKKLKVMTVVGTRPEIIRLSRVIPALDDATDHVLVHTGQNYDAELNEIFFRELALRAPTHRLSSAGATAMQTVANVLVGVEALIDAERPDAFLVLGDTNSCLATLVAKRHRIPTFHMEAGNRCFDHRVPEEANRRIIDHSADINLTYSAIARENLLREGLPADRVIRIGSPMFEVLAHYRGPIEASSVLVDLALRPGEYFVASAHREENVDAPQRLRMLIESLNQVARSHDRRIIFSTHPRTRLRLDHAALPLDPRIELLRPLGFLDYIKLQQNAACVLSDSGTITEEASILGFRALNLRETHERLEGSEEAAVMMTGIRPERVLQGLQIALAHSANGASTLRSVADYTVPNVATKVVRIILSYTDYVRRTLYGEALA